MSDNQNQLVPAAQSNEHLAPVAQLNISQLGTLLNAAFNADYPDQQNAAMTALRERLNSAPPENLYQQVYSILDPAQPMTQAALLLMVVWYYKTSQPTPPIEHLSLVKQTFMQNVNCATFLMNLIGTEAFAFISHIDAQLNAHEKDQIIREKDQIIRRLKRSDHIKTLNGNVLGTAHPDCFEVRSGPLLLSAFESIDAFPTGVAQSLITANFVRFSAKIDRQTFYTESRRDVEDIFLASLLHREPPAASQNNLRAGLKTAWENLNSLKDPAPIKHLIYATSYYFTALRGGKNNEMLKAVIVLPDWHAKKAEPSQNAEKKKIRKKRANSEINKTEPFEVPVILFFAMPIDVEPEIPKLYPDTPNLSLFLCYSSEIEALLSSLKEQAEEEEIHLLSQLSLPVSLLSREQWGYKDLCRANEGSRRAISFCTSSRTTSEIWSGCWNGNRLFMAATPEEHPENDAQSIFWRDGAPKDIEKAVDSRVPLNVYNSFDYVEDEKEADLTYARKGPLRNPFGDLAIETSFRALVFDDESAETICKEYSRALDHFDTVAKVLAFLLQSNYDRLRAAAEVYRTDPDDEDEMTRIRSDDPSLSVALEKSGAADADTPPLLLQYSCLNVTTTSEIFSVIDIASYPRTAISAQNGGVDIGKVLRENMRCLQAKLKSNAKRRKLQKLTLTDLRNCRSDIEVLKKYAAAPYAAQCLKMSTERSVSVDNEYRVLSLLNDNGIGEGLLPRVMWHGFVKDASAILTDKLCIPLRSPIILTSPSLLLLPVARFKFFRGLLAILELIHSRKYCFVDISSGNVGLEVHSMEPCFFDFGGCAPMNTPAKEYTLECSAVGIGEWRLTSALSDIESLFYLEEFAVTGSLPWNNLEKEELKLAKLDFLKSVPQLNSAVLKLIGPEKFAQILAEASRGGDLPGVVFTVCFFSANVQKTHRSRSGRQVRQRMLLAV